MSKPIRQVVPPGTYHCLTCRVPGCEEPPICKFMCMEHYWQWKNHGDPLKRVYRKRGTRTAEQEREQHRQATARYLQTEAGKEAHRQRNQINRNLKNGTGPDLDALREMFKQSHCPSCGDEFSSFLANRKKYRTIDHIIPLARGGTSDISNLRVICQSCNSKKQDRSPEIQETKTNEKQNCQVHPG